MNARPFCSSFIFHRSSLRPDAGSWRSSRAFPLCPAARRSYASCRGREPRASRAFHAGTRSRCESAARAAFFSVPPSSRSRSASLTLLAIAAAKVLVFVFVAKLLERFESRLYHVVRIRGAEGLGEDVLNAGRLEDRPHRTSGDDAGSIRRRFEQHPSRAVVAGSGMRNVGAGHRDRDHVFLGDLNSLLDSGRHFLGLPRSEADAALTVADDHQRAEAEVLAALDDFRDAVDVDDLVDHPAFASLFAA